MKLVAALTLTLAAAFSLAGCDRGPTPDPASPPQPQMGSSTPPPAERILLPPSPSAGASAEEKPDPGDANDHSTPRHDAKEKSGG